MWVARGHTDSGIHGPAAQFSCFIFGVIFPLLFCLSVASIARGSECFLSTCNIPFPGLVTDAFDLICLSNSL